jgi:hypothetical protein
MGDVRRLSEGDLSGITHLLSAYGGMGSLSDVVITDDTGDSRAQEKVARINDHIDALRSSIYTLAKRIIKMRRNRQDES